MQEENSANRKDSFNAFLVDMSGMAQELTTNIRASFSKALEQGAKSAKITLFPLLDAYETLDNIIIVTSPLIGLVAGSLEVSMNGGILSIKGETRREQSEPQGVCFHRERRFGAFSREIEIPFMVKSGEARAKLDGYVLTITLPKVIQTTPHYIPINL